MKPLHIYHVSCRKIFLAGVCAFLPMKAGATSPENQAWPSVVIETLTKAGVNIRFEQQLRLKSQPPVFKETFSELQFGYPISNNLGVTLYYRHIFYAHDTAWRVAASANIKSLPGRKSYSLRLKFQRQERQDRAPANHVRFRGTLSFPYTNKTVVLFLQGEPWLRLGDQQYWDRYRLTAGIRWKFAKRCSWDLFYRFQGDRQESGWSGLNILGLKFKTGL